MVKKEGARQYFQRVSKLFNSPGTKDLAGWHRFTAND